MKEYLNYLKALDIALQATYDALNGVKDVTEDYQSEENDETEEVKS